MLYFSVSDLKYFLKEKFKNFTYFPADGEECSECEDILEELEQIDGEADLFGIDFVKIASAEACQTYNIVNIPSLVYFRKQVPMLYDGDLHQHEKILAWLTSQDVFEIKNEIEEVNRKMLDKLLEENEFISVYFCKFLFCTKFVPHLY